MKVGESSDLVGHVVHEVVTAFDSDVFNLFDGVEPLVYQRFICQLPESLRRLNFGAVGRLKQRMNAKWPACLEACV